MSNEDIKRRFRDEDTDDDGDDEPRRGRGGDRGDDRRSRSPRGFGRRYRQGTYCPKGRCFNYKDVDTLKRYVTETGKIKPRRQTGNCSRNQARTPSGAAAIRHRSRLGAAHEEMLAGWGITHPREL